MLKLIVGKMINVLSKDCEEFELPLSEFKILINGDEIHHIIEDYQLLVEMINPDINHLEFNVSIYGDDFKYLEQSDPEKYISINNGMNFFKKSIRILFTSFISRYNSRELEVELLPETRQKYFNKDTFGMTYAIVKNI